MVKGGIDGSRISIVHSGVASKTAVAPRDWRAELGWPSDTVVGGIVGAMTAEKGVDLLASIGEALPASVKRSFRVVLLGGQKMTVTESGGVTVHSAGFVSDIDPAIAGLDLLLHPSKSEGLGTSVIDAMALGVPPVAFAVGGIPEVVVNEASGILVPAGDVAAFAKGVESLVGDPGLRAILGQGARERAKTFDAAGMTKGTEAVYNEVLSG